MKNVTTPIVKIFLCLFLCLSMIKKSEGAVWDINNVINGSQEVPIVITAGNGTTAATYNDATNLLTYTITFSNLTGVTTAGHFHGPASPGVNAGVQVAFSNIPIGVTSGSFSNSATLTAAQENQLLGGLWYSNIHTNFRPGGEIRGQLYPTLRIVNLTYLIEGLYSSGTNQLVSDTVTVNLRAAVSPFGLVDAAKGNLSSQGTIRLTYPNAGNNTSYYLQVLHRNALETWSAAPVNIVNDTANYDFTTSDGQAFGNNLKPAGSRYCAYSGDPSGDGSVDVGDIVLIYNDGSNFVTGYVPTDINGDDFVDIGDLVITYNNSINFVSVIRP